MPRELRCMSVSLQMKTMPISRAKTHAMSAYTAESATAPRGWLAG